MLRFASRLALLALPLGLTGCVVATPYEDDAYYARSRTVVIEQPEYRWARPRYRVEEHVYVPDRRRVYYGDDRREHRDRHDDHRWRREHDHDDHDHDHD